MSISVKNDDVQINREGTMVSVSTIQQSNETTSKVNKEDDTKRQLVCLNNRKSIIQSRIADKIPNMKEQMETNLKLLKFVADSKLTLTQVNGQRKLGPPPGWTGPPPGPKCEIFVGSIPRDYYEPEIVRIFSTVGTIYELRLMMEFSGTNRGYCFIMYTTEEEAARAVKELDQHEIYPGKKIGVVASTNNCRLYINQLPRIIDSKSIIKRIYEVTDDVDKVAVYRNLNGFVCYVLVSYKTHRGAAMARRRLVPESATLFKNCEVNIEWANANMTPYNVFEECGTCDEEGNIQITKTFIEPAKTKKVVARTKQKAIDKRSNIINNQRSQKLIGSSIQKGRPIKAAISSPVKNLGNPINQCKVEKCQSKSILCSNCSLIEFARSKDKTKENFNQTCDINGNLRDSLDQSFLHEHFKKNCVQHDQSNAILPAISTYLTYLNKGKRLKNFKWNDVQRYSNEALHSIENFAKNLTNAPCDLVNKCKLECSCQCRFHANNGLFNVSKLPTNKLQSVWNPTDGLVANFSETLKIAGENDNKNCVNYDQRNIYKNEHANTAENNVVHHVSNNFSNSQPFNESNHHRFSNCYQYANYYQNFGINNGEQSNGTFVQYPPNQNSGYNLQSGREFSLRQESNLAQQFSQQFPSTPDVNQMTINQNFNWFSPELLPMEIYRREPANIPDISNRILNDCKYVNNHHAIKSSQQQSNNESFFSPVSSKFEGRFSFENPINPINSSLYPKSAIYAESKPQFGENFRRL